MKLYIYDHCPFCVRARMILGIKGIDAEQIILQNDDEDTPIGMIGAKQVPILQKQDGSYMGESLDIVRYIDGLSNEGRLKEEIRTEIQTWLDKVNSYSSKLIQPRTVLIDLPEFSTQKAIDYFVNKKEQNIGSFQNNLEKTNEYLQQIHQDLATLADLIQSEQALNKEISMEDIHVFPILRNLTIVKDIVFPEKVENYIKNMSNLTGISLYTEKAV
ncbi:glutaredoxin 2 [Neisseria dumasiana]|uniref:Glutaredoxin, GrxB family n=1 Tax=Neisseria dumasiana TaxID=1931275 RepID=A0ABX3WQ91_9NEIS|nr:glutaredoxin 2 [Neisseria dumasiana]OSI36432.1 glutaredoxin, GrxB family [Neisseria dumasiana]UOO83972.1 glutaredoxin 2 [Neisseria dumasiana]